MRKLYRILLAASLAIGVGACDEQLIVNNDNNPDMERALARPGDVELLIVGSYNTFHGATYGFNAAPQIMNYGLENYSNLANNGMAVSSVIPRPPTANSRNSTGSGERSTTFNGLHRAARTAALGLSRVNQSTFTFFPTSIPQNDRAKAFAHFVMGISLGQLAMIYDSASAVHEDDDPSSTAAPIPIIGYDSLGKYALRRLALADSHAVLMGAQTIPITWMASTGATALTGAQFRGLIAGWKARIRANMPRTPAEAATVDWPQVLADATTFLTNVTTSTTGPFPNGEVVTQTNTVAGWDIGVMVGLYASASVNWHMMHAFMIGMADTLGSYQAWLDTPADLRAPYSVVTPDRRFPTGGAACNAFPPTGACRAAQQATQVLAYTGAPYLPYFQNRAGGGDWVGEPLATSQYRYGRWIVWSTTTSRNAPYVTMSRGEIQLLAAEANLRAGNFALAASRIDSTRYLRGLLPPLGAGCGPAVTAACPVPVTGQNLADGTTPVRGGSITAPAAPGAGGCVPRVPANAGAGFTTSCGNIWEALKWEVRMETAYTYMGSWFFAGRRWGDLPEGTPFMFPLPHQETDARGNPPNFYTMGGIGSPTGAAKGTYGI